MVVAPYGTRIGIRVNTHVLLEGVHRCLLPGWQLQQEPEVDFLWSLFQDEERSEVFYGDEKIGYNNPLTEFARNLHLYVGDTAQQRTFVHAGVVSFAGKALLLPGSSHAGKSTLTKALLDRGANYFSDDLAVIDEDGRVHAYPKPMSLRKKGGGTDEIAALQLGWRPHLEPLPVGLVARLRYGSEAAPWQTMTPAEATFALIENCLSARREPARDLRCLARACTGVKAVQGTRGEAGQAAAELLRLLA